MERMNKFRSELLLLWSSTCDAGVSPEEVATTLVKHAFICIGTRRDSEACKKFADQTIWDIMQ